MSPKSLQKEAFKHTTCIVQFTFCLVYFYRGECPSIRCIVLNRSPVELEAVVILRGSDDFSFIHVEDYGYVASYAPR